MAEVITTPELRFPEFNNEWKKTTIKKVANKITDGTHDTPKPIQEGIPYLTAIHVKNGFIDFDNCYYLPQEVHDKIYERCNPEYGDLLMVNIGAGTATSAIVNVNFEFSLKNVALIKPNPEIIDRELFAQIQRRNSGRLRHQISAGGAQPFLSLKEIAKLKLTIPTNLPEQQKIASFLTAIDQSIQLLQKKKAKLEEYKKGVMQKLFSQEIRFKDENGNDFPDWEKKKLGEVFNSKKGTGLSKNVLDPQGQFNCILYGELYTTYAEVIFDVVSKTNDEGGTLSKQGDLLVPCSTTTSAIDLANVTALNEDNVRLGGDITILRARKNVNNTFYAYYLSNYKKLEIAKYGQGTTIVHLYYNHFKVMPIDVPSIEEQNKIAIFLTSLDKSIESLGNEIERTTTFKKGLLQKMFV